MGMMELTTPNHFRCPISLDLMKDPVTLSTGITYDRESIETWMEAGNRTCPITNQELKSPELIPNHTIRKMIQDWCVENRSFGIERIPTPRIPLSSVEVKEMLYKFRTAYRREDEGACRELVAKMKSKGKESDRNKRCLVANGAAAVLSAAFEAFSSRSSASASFDKYVLVLEDILAALSWIFPQLDGEAKSYLGSAASLNCLVWLLKSGDLSARGNAVSTLKELVSGDKRKVDALAEIQGVKEALVKLVREPICPTATKTSLMVIYYMVSSSSSNEDSKLRFSEMGMVELLLELLVESEKSVCEKALGVLDSICGCDQGREKAYADALTVPVLVKKLLRVSDLATEFSVSILWKLGKNEKREDGGVLVEALQVGAFQKLLLLLQVGSSDRTKGKATELLKLLNIHRERLECIDSMDFKDLKRPF